ncbi:MAG: sugar ABC transporter ATP-binding protein [Alphaproteobacteria bacterium]
MQSISKAFGGVQALREVTFSADFGEIHALMGENGAGKSTILKILRGVYAPDAGTIAVDGRPLAEHTPDAARRLGVAMIFQEMSLIPSLTVAQNVFLAREKLTGLGLIDDVDAQRRTRALFDQLGVDIDPGTELGRLSTGQRQLTEIAKALSQEARVLVLDEPTSALSAAETRVLFAFLRRIRSEGVCVIYVSHRMEEVFAIADRTTVLRDGRHVITARIADLTMDQMVQHIVGRRVGAFARRDHAVDRGGVPLLEVEGLSGAVKPNGVGFALHAGEILGIGGLLGSGRSELARALCGIDPIRAGRVRLRGREIAVDTPRRAIAQGIALIPEDRVRQGLILQHDIGANVRLTVLDHITRTGFVDDRRGRSLVDDLMGKLRVKAKSQDTRVGNLSGGNQQKVVLAKWLAATPDILVLDEPTAGVDIGSKVEIVELIRLMADEGKGIIFISSELPELLAVSDRILILGDGRLLREIDHDEIDGWSADIAEPEARIAASEHALQLAMQQAADHG